MVAQACLSSTQDAEAGGSSRVPGQLKNDTLSQKQADKLNLKDSRYPILSFFILSFILCV